MRIVCSIACLILVCTVGCTAAQWERHRREYGKPTDLENRLRDRVLAGEATPGELEVWRSEVISRTAIGSAGRARQAEIADAMASAPVVVVDSGE